MLKDLIYLSSFYLNLNNVTDYLTALDGEEELIDEDRPVELESLITLSNLVIRNVARKFAPLYFEEVLTSNENCEISFDNFSKSVNEVKMVTLNDGLSVTFRVFPEFIKVGLPNTSYKVSYSYIPEEVRELDATLPLPTNITEDDLCFGVCAEYATMEMLYDEASVFESKFKESLIRSLIGKKEKQIKSRGWL